MNRFPRTIFEFVGEYTELARMRSVCKDFKQSITKSCVLRFHLTETNKHVLNKYSQQLLILVCKGRQLEELPNLPKVKILDCSDNRIETLPELPCIEHLNCSNNKLLRLGEYPHLETLDCTSNRIRTCPDFPNIKTLNSQWSSVIIALAGLQQGISDKTKRLYNATQISMQKRRRGLEWVDTI